MPPKVQVQFDEGAVLAPNRAAVTIQGRITCHPLQKVFGGTGYSTAVSPNPGSGPALSVGGNPFGNYTFYLKITQSGNVGGPPPAPLFEYSLDGVTWSTDRTAAASYELEGTGLTITFNPGPYNNSPVPYSWNSFAAITVGLESFDTFHVENWGAIADYDYATSTWTTDNADPFQLTLGAIQQCGNRHAKLAAKGHFFLTRGIVIQESVTFEGYGREAPTAGGNRSSPGTWLVFPRDVNGIRVMSGDEPGPAPTQDNPALPVILGTGDETVIRNLMIWCNYERPNNPLDPRLPPPPDVGQTGHGLWINAPVRVENVGVENFGGTGVFVDAGGDGPPITVGNASLTLLERVSVGGCGGHGFHFKGSDTSVCMIHACVSDGNYGWAFLEESSGGNTYVACHASVNLGLINDGNEWRNYKNSDGGTNESVFLGCYQEGNFSRTNELWFPAVVLGGVLSDPDIHAGDATVLDGCYLGGRALNYTNKRGPVQVYAELGAGDASGGAFSFGTPQLVDYHLLRYNDADGWWSLNNSTSNGRSSISFPTTISGPRATAALFQNGFFFGTPAALTETNASKVLTRQTSGSGIPTDGTWEIGDIVWNTAPAPGTPAGWVCTTAGTQGALGGPLGTRSAGDPPRKVFVPPGTGLQQWQYITIDKVPGILQIVNDPSHSDNLNPFVILDTDVGAPLAGAALAYSPAAFTPMAQVGDNAGVGELSIDVSGGAPTNLSDGQAAYQIIKFVGAPAAPVSASFPSPATDASAYQRTIRNNSGQNVIVGLAGGIGSTVAVPANSNAQLVFDSAGVFAI
jgi:hypothetical protein